MNKVYVNDQERLEEIMRKRFLRFPLYFEKPYINYETYLALGRVLDTETFMSIFECLDAKSAEGPDPEKPVKNPKRKSGFKFKVYKVGSEATTWTRHHTEKLARRALAASPGPGWVIEEIATGKVIT